jgi:hypothetical protein
MQGLGLVMAKEHAGVEDVEGIHSQHDHRSV